MQSILGLYKEFEKNFQLHPLLEPTSHNLIKEILEHMMASVDFNKIIGFITDNFEKIPFKHFKENICQVLAQHSYQKNIVRKAISLLANDVKDMTSHLYGYQTKGVTSQEICGNCEKTLTSDRVYKEKFVIFVCGHGFHSRCVHDDRCSVCIERSQKTGELVFRGTANKFNG